MSLFIAGLAFEGAGSAYIVQTRLGILASALNFTSTKALSIERSRRTHHGNVAEPN